MSKVESLLQQPADVEEWEALADQLAAELAALLTEDIPVLSEYAVSREGIYGDHP